jgi:putative transcriptional regulator
MPPTLHNRLRELRQARSWTQEELAALTGVSRQSINSIERDRYIPSLPLALTLAQVFRCPVEQLFTLDPPNNHKEPQP